jgi:hypothetical protein
MDARRQETSRKWLTAYAPGTSLHPPTRICAASWHQFARMAREAAF